MARVEGETRREPVQLTVEVVGAQPKPATFALAPWNANRAAVAAVAAQPVYRHPILEQLHDSATFEEIGRAHV